LKKIWLDDEQRHSPPLKKSLPRGGESSLFPSPPPRGSPLASHRGARPHPSSDSPSHPTKATTPCAYWFEPRHKPMVSKPMRRQRDDPFRRVRRELGKTKPFRLCCRAMNQSCSAGIRENEYSSRNGRQTLHRELNIIVICIPNVQLRPINLCLYYFA
jgi:hypothetical protein